MTGYGKHVNFHPLRINRKLAVHLHTVHMEKRFRVTFLYAFSDFGNRFHSADFVIYTHHGNQYGILANGGFQFFDGNQTVLIRSEISDFEALFLQLFHRV